MRTAPSNIEGLAKSTFTIALVAMARPRDMRLRCLTEDCNRRLVAGLFLLLKHAGPCLATCCRGVVRLVRLCQLVVEQQKTEDRTSDWEQHVFHGRTAEARWREAATGSVEDRFVE
eukprot:1160944-Pelagomonas_calceolata.AAC.14